MNVDDIPEDNVEGDSSALIAEQKADPSLASYWKAAEVGRPGVVVHRDTLCQKDQVEGQPMSHVCAPEGHKTSARSDGCVDGCAAVSDDDAGVGIGRVVTLADVVMSNLCSAHTEEAELERLVELRSRELIRLVDEFADRVGDEADLCDAAVRRVQTSSDFVTRQVPPCRVPDRSRPEVYRPSHERVLRNAGATDVSAELTDRQPIRTTTDHLLTIWLVIVIVRATVCCMCVGLLAGCDCGYYREYVPRYAEIAKPLTDLTRDCVPCKLGTLWTEECQNALDSLCQQLTSHRVLRVPTEGQPFVLHTDSSGKAVGASLGQLDECGVEQPLAFASQKLNPTQQIWSTIEREAYAVIWALNKYRDLIFGSKVTVYCDHNPLQYIRECAPKSAKLLRWSLALQEFDLDLVYKKGSSNVVADWLSRKCC